MKPIVVAAGVLAGLLMSLCGAASWAEEARNRVVVELFTSQGCSSCPPADALLERLAERDDVLALALHVDYWDYIGWADSFARPEHTKRQKAYARLAGSRTIYTPQMVIGGVEQIVGARPMDVMDAVLRHVGQAAEVELVAMRDGASLRITAAKPANPSGKMLVQLVRYIPHRIVKIERGENAGKTVEYTNIVSDWQILEEWTGAAPLEIVADASGSDSAAVIVQQAENGRILAAADLP
ncbi:DUF1223 domain-containing protein [Tropicimonas marinistellae]|uniref:DUF1223 domain-containing protein n=1 Tax=Tropicimonas marinistellae TaxID=1739787 RepID=UPI00098F701E|nr:DUF1223 domain-containing protein [Tropicimonas marinistellae]